MQDLENNNGKILELIQNISDSFRQLLQNIISHILSEFISNNTKAFR